MGIEARHAYRFGYLQSEHWKNLRIQKLAECDARCHICNLRDLENDVHHIYYPPDLFKTRLHVLRVLCRKHHEMVHAYMDANQKRIDAVEAGNEWHEFRQHYDIFKSACQSIENKMKLTGETCYTVFGVRLRDIKHLDRLVPFRSMAGEELPREIRRARMRIAKFSKRDGCMDQFRELLKSLKKAELMADELANKRRGQYAIEFIRNETAGWK